ncbi:MAG: hypothetical protein GF308_13000 [Candidatus Heimdallarchaeota archaeon]|nr:hypothetical protein [Candidatus Heimdallarchaeota archaeon]
MGTENAVKQVDLIVLTGSIPFITAGIIQNDQSEATLISGALSGMSTMFQEMLKQGQLRHSELYNAHIYIRHLSQMDAPPEVLEETIKDKAQMSAVLIVREAELTQEEEIALSELCYSIMVKICDRPNLTEKIIDGSIDGYIPENKEVREILAAAIEDYRYRAKKSIFYESSDFLDDKARFKALSTQNEILENQIEEFCQWITHSFYPPFFPKINFKDFFGKQKYWQAAKELKKQFEKCSKDEDFKEELKTILFEFILKAGIMPLVLYSGDILERTENFFNREFPDTSESFIQNLLAIRGPAGISLRGVERNLERLENRTDPDNISWNFLNVFLQEIANHPFEQPFLEQFCQLLELFNISQPFVEGIANPQELQYVPNEYQRFFIDIINDQLSSPVDVDHIWCEIPEDDTKSTLSEIPLPSDAKKEQEKALLEDLTREYCKLRDSLEEGLQNIRSSITEKIEEKEQESKKQVNQKKEGKKEFIAQLSKLLKHINMEKNTGSYGILVKQKINDISSLINEENFAEAKSSVSDLLETFETLEMSDTKLAEILQEIDQTIQEILSFTTEEPSKKEDSKLQQTSSKILEQQKEVNEKIRGFLDLIKTESYSELLTQLENHSELFGEEVERLKTQVVQLNNLKEELHSIQKSEIKEKPEEKTKKKTTKKKKKKKKKIKLPKISPEASRVKDRLLFKAICDTFHWTHKHLFGQFAFSKKYLPLLSPPGLLFTNITESLVIELGLMIDLIQCYTGPRTMLINQLRRILNTVEEKLRAYSPDSGEKYPLAESLLLDVDHVSKEFKELTQELLDTITRIEADAFSGKITEENKKDYLESGFFGRAQEISVPSAQKILNELKSKNKKFYKRDLEKISEAINLDLSEVSTDISPIRDLSQPFLSRESDYSKSTREIINHFKKWDLSLPEIMMSLFRVYPEIPDPTNPYLHQKNIPTYLRANLSANINKKFDEKQVESWERRNFIQYAFQLKEEILSLLGKRMISEDIVTTIFQQKIDKQKNMDQYIIPYLPIQPPKLSEELRHFFLLSEDDDKTIQGRILPYQPFTTEKPSNLAGLIISDAFRRAYDTVKINLEKIMKLGSKLHSGTEFLHDKLLESYELIKSQWVPTPNK